MEQQNLIMENILKTLDILRKIARVLVVSHRLPLHISSEADILKISQNIRELGKKNFFY